MCAQRGIERQTEVRRRPMDFRDQLFFEAQIERQGPHRARSRLQQRYKIRPEPATHQLTQIVGIFRQGRVIGDPFQDQREIENRYIFAEQILQHALDDTEIDQVRQQLADERRMRLLHMID